MEEVNETEEREEKHPHIELLMSLFSEWYGVRYPSFSNFNGYSEERFAKQWTKLWFAKGQDQIQTDAYLQKFKELFAIDTIEDIEALKIGLTKNEEVVCNISLLILWDQIPRNIYRGSAAAYGTDSKARRLAETLMLEWSKYPVPIRVSLILVFIHSEDMADLARVEELLEDIKSAMQLFPSVWKSLTAIAKNHSLRMTTFSRIPERNAFLGRASTEEEMSFMSIFSI